MDFTYEEIKESTKIPIKVNSPFDIESISSQIKKLEDEKFKMKHYIGVSKDDSFCSYSLVSKYGGHSTFIFCNTYAIKEEQSFDKDVADLVRIFDAIKIEETN